MTSSKPTPGHPHAPGVKCLVAVKPDPADILKLQLLKFLFGKLPADGSKTERMLDNGRIVRLKSRCIGPCPVCGEKWPVPPTEEIIWWVEPADSGGTFRSSYALHDYSTAIFWQNSLIPLGGEDLELEIAAESTTGEPFTVLHVDTGVQKDLQTAEQKGVDKHRTLW